MSQAEKMNTTNLSRRATLAGLLGGATAAVVPAAASQVDRSAKPRSNPDDALLKLVDEYFAEDAEQVPLNDIVERAIEKQWAKNPMPDVLRWRPEDEALGLYAAPAGATRPEAWDLPYLIDMIRVSGRCPLRCRVAEKIAAPEGMEFYYGSGGEGIRYLEPSEAARARAAEIVRAFDGWFPRRNRTSRRFRAIARKTEGINMRVLGCCWRRSRRTPALTIAGLVAKAKIAAAELPDESDHALAHSIARDLAAFGTAEAAQKAVSS